MKILIDRALYTELVGAFRDAVNNLETFSEHDDDLQTYFYDLLEKVEEQYDGSMSLNGMHTRVVKTLKDLYMFLGELLIAMNEDLELFKDAKEVHLRALKVINELEVAKNG